MPDFQLTTPVAFIIFNRPETAIRVFEEIRRARPPKLLVVADGPRPERVGEAALCDEARKIAVSVDWPCEVLTNFSSTNLGCRKRVSSGLDWVFQMVEEAIILEDDCLPHPSFFRFCQELLDRYRNDERIMMISGDNFQFGRKQASYSYYYSRYTHIWGWASWRRAWRKYDVNMNLWPLIRSGHWLSGILENRASEYYWRNIFEQVSNNKIDTWDYQWTFSCWLHSGLVILPSVNLISNIGFGPAATHIKEENNRYANMPTEEMHFPLNHPIFVMRDIDSDANTQIRLMSLLTHLKMVFYAMKTKTL